MFNPFLQDLLLLSQQLYRGGREEPVSVIFTKQSSRHHKALAVMGVCVALDFIGLLAVPRVLHQAEFPLHLLFSVCKGTFLAFDVDSLWSARNSWCFSDRVPFLLSWNQS